MIFKTIDGMDFVIKEMKNFIIFEINQDSNDYNFSFNFEEDVFSELTAYIEETCNKKWKNFEPKEANSLRSDYFEYYDRKLDNNGYLSLLNNGFKIERPSLDSLKLYQLNKARLESLIYDIYKLKK